MKVKKRDEIISKNNNSFEIFNNKKRTNVRGEKTKRLSRRK